VRAQHYLRDMGVMKELVDEEKCQFLHSGGFVSPCGNSFVGNDTPAPHLEGKYNRGSVMTVKRMVLDEKVVHAAQRMGAELVEKMNVVGATFSVVDGIWTVECRSEGNAMVVYKARALVCADGAPSKIARHLGLVKTDPNAVCSRAYVAPPHPFNWDTMQFYPSTLLPGHCSIRREIEGEINYTTYILAGGSSKEEDLARLHHEFMKSDPYISQALGPTPAMERMKASSLRTGGIEKSYADHLLIVGDAAGFADPFTGEGISYAMEGGFIAAEVLSEGFRAGDLSHQFLQTYQTRWKQSFGQDFYYSMKIALVFYRFPILLDAAAKMIQRRGSRFLTEWVRVMGGMARKTKLVRVDVWPFLFMEIILEMLRRQFRRPHT